MRANRRQQFPQVFALILKDDVDAGLAEKHLSFLARAEQVDLGELGQSGKRLQKELLSFSLLDSAGNHQPQAAILAVKGNDLACRPVIPAGHAE